MSALAVADTAVGLTLAGCGAILVTRRKVRIGALLTGVSAAWFLGNVWSALVFLHRGPMVHLHLSYPTGRLRRWPARVTVIAAYAWAVAEGWGSQPTVTAAVAGAIAVAAVDGYLQARGPARHAARPALIAALLFASVLALSAANLLLHWQADRPVALTYDAVMITVAIWLTVDLLRGRWTEDTLADLVTHLGGDPAGTGVEAELRRALGDPTLLIASPNEPVDTTGRAVTKVDADGKTIAVLVHDPGLLDDPTLLAGAVAALRLAVSSSVLRAQITARADELATARRRLIEASDEQRRLLQADLESGPQTDLHRAEELLTMTAPGRDDIHTLIEHLAGASAELRRFAQGLRPANLDADGLAQAIRRLTERSSPTAVADIDVGPLPPPVEAAVYFVCAEALTNAAKHAQAHHIRLAIHTNGQSVEAHIADDGIGGADPAGTGLQGLADRVTALGGTLTVDSPVGSGTILHARIPIKEHKP